MCKHRDYAITDRSMDLSLVKCESNGFAGGIVECSFNIKEDSSGVFSSIKCFLNPTSKLKKKFIEM